MATAVNANFEGLLRLREKIILSVALLKLFNKQIFIPSSITNFLTELESKNTFVLLIFTGIKQSLSKKQNPYFPLKLGFCKNDVENICSYFLC